MLNVIKMIFNRCMTEPEFNSRFIFFSSAMVHTLGVLAIIIAFIVAKDKDAYPTMIVALGGGGAAAAVGRYVTKKGDAVKPVDNPDGDNK